MKPTLRTCAALGVAALFLAAAPRASADTITLEFTGTSGATPISYTLNGNPGSTTPGPYTWNQTSPPNAGTVSTWCIELTQTIPSGAIAYTVNTNLSQSPTIGTSAKGQAITALYGNKGSYSDAAFQLALWELVYDGTADLGDVNNTNFFAGGSLTSTDAATSSAQSLLHATLTNINGGLNNFTANNPNSILVALSSPDSQDQLYLQPKFPATVPAPPAVLLAGIGLLALGGRARWNRRGPNPA